MPDETLPVTPQPEAPAKPSVSSTALEKYFQSIEEPFRETRCGLAIERKGINGVFILFFVFSLIPLVPFLVSFFVSRYFGATLVSVRAIHFHVGSFWFWWVVLFVVSLGLLLLAGKFSGVSTEEKKKWLSPPQMRFAYCYATIDEIQKYRTNQLPRHIDSALQHLEKADGYLLSASGIPINVYPERWRLREMQLAQQHALEVEGAAPTGPPKWYRLKPETELVLKAFGEFTPKLRDRIKDRKDLPAIQTALTFLASYLYLEIPALSDSGSGARFEEGMQSLLTFAQQVTSLPPYRSEELKPTPKQQFSLKLLAVFSIVSAPFGHENLLVAFLSWFVLLFLLFGIGLFEASRLLAIKADSVIITTLISGPILGAVTAVTIPRIGRRKSGT